MGRDLIHKPSGVRLHLWIRIVKELEILVFYRDALLEKRSNMKQKARICIIVYSVESFF